MRIFAGRGQLASLPLEARVLYTVFSLFLLVGYGSSVWLYSDGIGFSNDSTARWYRGDAAPPDAPEGEGGPAVELPEDTAPVLAIAVEKPARQLAETFHFHLFTVPIVLLIVGHLFMLARLPQGFKVAVIVLTSVATMAHLFAPLIVRFGAARWAWLMPATGLPMAAGFIYMTAHPVYEMWRPRPRPLVLRGSETLDHVHSASPRS